MESWLQGIQIIFTLQERIQEAYPCLPVLISQSIINIIRCVVGSRPEIHVVMTMCDFLLLMHPAASTYVHHEPYHFYFMQNWGMSILVISTTERKGISRELHHRLKSEQWLAVSKFQHFLYSVWSIIVKEI